MPKSLIKAISDWRPHPPFYYGWLVLGVGALGAIAATGVAQVVLGGIQNLIFEDMGWDRSTIAYAVTAGTLLSGLLTPFVGRLADRHGPRGVMPATAVVVAACLFALSRIRAVWHFYVAYIIARGIANPVLIGVMPRTVAVNFFHRKRNLALGLGSSARPIGGAINIQFLSLMAQAYGWRVGYRFLSVFALALAAPLYLIMRRRPEDIGLLPDGDRTAWSSGVQHRGSSIPVTRGQEGTGEFEWRVRDAVLTPTLWLIIVAEALAILTAGALSFQVVPYLLDAGLGQTLAAGALSLSTLLGAMVNPGWGYLSDAFQPRRLALVALSVTLVTTFLFLLVDSGQRAFFVVILWGTASGGLNILGNMMLAQYFGRASFGSIAGLMGPFQLGALGLGPTFGAVLFNVTGGYTAMFVYGLGAYSVAMLLIYFVRPPRLPRRALIESRSAAD